MDIYADPIMHLMGVIQPGTPYVISQHLLSVKSFIFPNFAY